MKRGTLLTITFAILLIAMPMITAENCNLDISLINQDPYPAIPGDYVKLVFQIDGVDNPECGTVNFELLGQYPLIFDPDEDGKYTINSGTYNKDYQSYFLAPFKIRIDQDALDGDNPMSIRYKYGFAGAEFEEQFNLNIEDTHANFEIYIKDYDSTTKTLTLEILNTADVDAELVRLEMPTQENIDVKGSKRKVVGDLDSNEYTTADFEATPREGEIHIKITYQDKININRTIEKTILYEPEYFQDRVDANKKSGAGTYIIIIIIILIIIYYFYKRHKRKQKLKNRHK